MTDPDKTALLVEFGVVDYGKALELQRELVHRRMADEIPDTLVLLEHPPVITLGKHADRQNLLASEDELIRRGVTLYQVERGGDITFHGPGQLVGYPVFKLGSGVWAQGSGGTKSEARSQMSDVRSADDEPRAAGGLVGVRRFVEAMEQALILALAELGVRAATRPGFIGIWVSDSIPRTLEPLTPGTLSRKIASLGIAVKRGVTMHGFALNVTTDLSWFGLMNPCGMERVEMTSVGRELGLARIHHKDTRGGSGRTTETQRQGGAEPDLPPRHQDIEGRNQTYHEDTQAQKSGARRTVEREYPQITQISQIGVQTGQDTELMKLTRAAVVRGFEQAFGVSFVDSPELIPDSLPESA